MSNVETLRCWDGLRQIPKATSRVSPPFDKRCGMSTPRPNEPHPVLSCTSMYGDAVSFPVRCRVSCRRYTAACQLHVGVLDTLGPCCAQPHSSPPLLANIRHLSLCSVPEHLSPHSHNRTCTVPYAYAVHHRTTAPGEHPYPLGVNEGSKPSKWPEIYTTLAPAHSVHFSLATSSLLKKKATTPDHNEQDVIA